MLALVGGNRPFATSTVPKMKQFAENVRDSEAAQSTISSICLKFWAGLEMLKNCAFESVGDSQCGRYWVPMLNYFLLQSMLLLLMMHLFYLLVFASFFLIVERKLPVRIAPWTLFVLLWLYFVVLSIVAKSKF
ncbi:hypothetical protein C1H46_011464 [Malus baccata]|uniref:Uncharacterized protein n=1 Tax=Malus baccata TaxID=106549 RepID=A0A540MVS6_MALBA|nr:hypothetical protein C1H46_011464 [Malus baccata]